MVTAAKQPLGPQQPTAAAKRLGARIRRARRQAGLSQAQLAERTGVKHPQSVSRWERGMQLPGLERVETIAAVTKKPLGFFLEQDSEVPLLVEAQAEDALRRFADLVEELASLVGVLRVRPPGDHRVNGAD